MSVVGFEDRPPESRHVTAYDERHLKTYLRLIDADDEGVDWRTVVQLLFGIDAAVEPDRAKAVHQSHLARARWMTEHGYRDLLRPRMQ